MNEVDDGSPGPSSGRRKLIHGAFAVPAVATVHSGSALATSSSLRCLQNQVTSPHFPAVGPKDNFLRVELAKLSKSGKTPKYYVVGARVASYPRTASYASRLGSSQWQEFNKGSNIEVGGALGSQPSDSGWTYSASSGEWAVLRFDSQGLVAGVGIGPAGTSAVAGSCWTSFA